MRFGAEYKYYINFRENNDTIQILKVPDIQFWHEGRDSIPLQSVHSTFILDKKFNSKFRTACSKAIKQANYAKQRKGFICCASETILSVGFKSASYGCTHGYKTNLLQTLIDFSLGPMILNRIPLDLKSLNEDVDGLLKAYKIE